MQKTDFEKFAYSKGINSLYLHDYANSINSGYQSPMILEQSPMHATSLDIFSRLMADRIIFMGTNVSAESANIITSQLLYLDNVNDNDISIYVNSPGGDVYSGLQIYDTMQFVKSDVSTICAGLAASMGSIILCGGTTGKRFALPHSRVLIHQPMSGCAPGTQASDIEIASKEVNKLKKELYDIISKHSGQSIKRIIKDADRDYWMTTAEAKSYGMIDEIVSKKG